MRGFLAGFAATLALIGWLFLVFGITPQVRDLQRRVSQLEQQVQRLESR